MVKLARPEVTDEFKVVTADATAVSNVVKPAAVGAVVAVAVCRSAATSARIDELKV